MTMAIRSATGLGSMFCLYASKTGRGVVLPSCGPQATVGQLEYLWKLYAAKT